MKVSNFDRGLTLLTTASLLTIFPLAAAADNDGPVKILNDEAVSAQHYLPDFSYAGYNNGVGDIPR